MNHTANHAEGPRPQAHEHTTTRVPRDQYPFVQARWAIRTAAAQEGAQVFWNVYAQYAPRVPQSQEVTDYEQAQQQAAQRNLGANVVQVTATQPYEAQPVPQASEVTRYQVRQEAAQSAISATPAVEVNLVDGTDETVEPLAQEMNDPLAPADIAADAGINLEELRERIRNMA